MAGEIIGKVQSIQGLVRVRGANGQIRQLMVGDELHEGDSVLTDGNGKAVIQLADGGQVSIEPGQMVAMTSELSAGHYPGADEAHVASIDPLARAVLEGNGDLNRLLDAQAPAAGQPGDPGNEGHTFVQLLRVVENADAPDSPTTVAFGSGGPVIPRRLPLINEGPVATPDENDPAVDSVIESGIGAGGTPVPGDNSASGNVLTNDRDADSPTLVVVGISVNGVPGVVGQPVVGTHGTVVVNADGSYTYTLDNSDPDTDSLAVGQTATDVFVYTVADGSGNTDSTTLTINITGTNDAPVITGADGSGAVTEDASNPTLSDTGTIRFDDVDLVDSHTVSVTAAGNNTLGGTLTATVTDPATGAGGGTVTWVYNVANAATQYLDDGETATENFTVTISDGNGGTVSQTVTVVVSGANDVPTITVTTGNEGGNGGANDIVYEAGLGAGSGQGNTTTTVGGTFKLADADGLDDIKTVTINGDTFAIGNLVNQSVNGSNGTLTITGYNAETGVASYSYTLNSPSSDVANVTETDQFTLSTSDGTVSSTPATITIEIVDDLPMARDDSASQAPENAPIVIDVLANDSFGADGAHAVNGIALVPDSLTGAGTLAYANGVYTYTPTAGEEGTVSFQYTITDADGDTSTATATITLATDSTPTLTVVQAGDGAVDEAVLNSSPTDTTSGSFTIGTGGDTLGSLVITGVNGPVDVSNGGTVQGQYGSLTVTVVNGSYSWTYTLSDNTLDHNNPNSTGTSEGVADTFGVVVTDSDGDATPSTPLTIAILDDGPVATNDSGTQIGENAPIAVNVLANDAYGADGPNAVSSIALVPNSLTGAGTLSYANGVYTYTPKAGEEGTVSFQYTITDADGDTSTATATITLATDSTPTLTVVQAGDGAVDEAVLNSSPTDTTSGSFTIGTGGDTLGSLVITGVNGPVDVSNGGTVQGQYGSLTVTVVNGSYTWTYTLSDNTLDHNNPNSTGTSEGVADTFGVVVTDSDGDATPSTPLTIAILDDGPVATNDSATQVGENTPVAINVLANDTFGADGPNAVSSIALVPNSLTGAGTLAYANGVYTYTPKAGEEGTVSFQYTITDADGDTSTATATITLAADSTPTLTVVQAGDGAVDEAVLNSSPTDTTSGSFTIGTGGDTLGSLVITGVNGPVDVSNGGTVQGQYGSLTVTVVNGSYSWTYTLSDNTLDHNNPNSTGTSEGVADTFGVVVTDSDGDATPSTPLTIAILDDGPVARNDVDSVTEDGPLLATGNVITGSDTAPGDANTSDGVADAAGADGVGSVVWANASNGAVAGQYGTLTIAADGSYSYALNNGSSVVQALGVTQTLTETFSYTLVDGDGDRSLATLTVTINGSDDTPTIGTAENRVSEEGLLGGLPDSLPNSALDTTDSPVAIGTGSTALPITANGSPIASVTLTGPTDVTSHDVSVTWSGSFNAATGTYTLVGTAGATPVATVTLDTSGNYNFTLQAPIDHPDGNGENTLALQFGVTATSQAGDTSLPGSLTITVEDDAPVASPIEQTLEVAQTNVLIVLDISSSMNNPSGIAGLNRLQASIQSINNLLVQYEAQGDVAVRIVTFDGSASAIGSGWTSAATAAGQLAGVTSGNGTNYDAALAAAQLAFPAGGAIAGGHNIAYFFSDGEPNPVSSGIDGAEEAVWKNFLTSNDIDAYAIGIGTGAVSGPLDPIAYNGQTGADRDSVVVTDFGQLDAVLASTMPAPVSGNLLEGPLPGAEVGADGGYIQNLTVGTTTYTFNPAGGGSVNFSGGPNNGVFDTATNTLKITTSQGGTWTVDLDNGSYSYQGPAKILGVNEVLGFTIRDNDGDTAASTVTVVAPLNAPPVAVDNTAFSSEAGTAAGINPTGNVLANDINDSIGTLTVTAIRTGEVEGSGAPGTLGTTLTGQYGTLVIGADGNYTYTLNNANTAVNGLGVGQTLTDSFNYTVSDGTSADIGVLKITITGSNDAPVVGSSTARVSEEGLSGGNADSSGSSDLTDSAIVRSSDGGSLSTGAVSITDGDADGSRTVTLSGPGGFTSNGQAITWIGSGTQADPLVGTAGGRVIATVTINGNGEYVFALAGQIDHPTAGGENQLQLAFGVNVNDGSGTANAVGTGTLNIIVEDDSHLAAVSSGKLVNSVGSTLLGSAFDLGGDVLGSSFSVTGNALPTTLKSEGLAVNYSGAGTSQITAYTTLNGVNQTVFTLNLQADGSYVFQQVKSLDLFRFDNVFQAGVDAGGPASAYYSFAPTTVGGASSFGSDPTGKDWTVRFSSTAGNTINPSTQGIGVSNNLFNSGEKLFIEVDDEKVSGNRDLASQLSVGVADLGAGETVTATYGLANALGQPVLDANNQAIILTTVITSAMLVNGTYTFQAPFGQYIDYVNLQAGATTSVRITTVAIGVLDDTITSTLNFNVTATDRDGDATATSPLQIIVQNPTTITGTLGDDALAGGTGADTLSGGTGHDILSGNAGVDTLNGDGGNDQLYGGAGNDILSGGDNDDLLVGGADNDTLNGGNGIDTASYAGAASSVTVNLAAGLATGGAGNDTLSSIENVVGSSFNDTLIGNSVANVITGGAGNDTMTGGDGADTFVFRLADKGTGGTPAVDTITDFNTAPAGAGGDVLDLRDLLQGEAATTASLDNYLSFNVSGGNTTISVSSSPNGPVEQQITLTGVNLAAGTDGSDAQIIQNLLNGNKLLTDGG